MTSDIGHRTLNMTLVLLALLLCGCGEPRGLPRENMDLVAWYIEDQVHGNIRRPEELALTTSTPEMEKVATWLSGTMVRDQHIFPRHLESRRQRWTAIKALFREGHVVVLDDGLIAAIPSVSKEDQSYIFPVIDSENNDRRHIDALVISMINADHAAAKSWLARAAAARIALDVQAGAKRWVGKY
jgi:hypothetical protein